MLPKNEWCDVCKKPLLATRFPPSLLFTSRKPRSGPFFHPMFDRHRLNPGELWRPRRLSTPLPKKKITSNPPIPALLIDMPEPLPLLAVLEQASGRHDKHKVDTDHAEHGGEDVVEEDVGERGDGCGTAAHKSRGRWAGTGRISDERGGGAVEVTAAVELCHNQ